MSEWCFVYCSDPRKVALSYPIEQAQRRVQDVEVKNTMSLRPYEGGGVVSQVARGKIDYACGSVVVSGDCRQHFLPFEFEKKKVVKYKLQYNTDIMLKTPDSSAHRLVPSVRTAAGVVR